MTMAIFNVVPDSGFSLEKVVPVPAAPVLPESAPGFEEQFELDEKNNLIPRKTPLKVVPTIVEEATTMAAETIVDRYDELEEAVGQAIHMLKGDAPENALDVLVEALSSRVNWCSCSPLECLEGERLGCRQNSPLIK